MTITTTTLEKYHEMKSNNMFTCQLVGYGCVICVNALTPYTAREHPNAPHVKHIHKFSFNVQEPHVESAFVKILIPSC